MQTLQFNPYSASQLEEILEKRVEQAFRPGTIEDGVVRKIAEQVAETGGDCRQALELLLRLGRRSDRQGESEVSTDDL